jgi:hypothetical protein
VIARLLLVGFLCIAARASADKEMLLDGTHWRLATEHGPVHVWRPPRYDRRTAGTVIYLHGWYDNADQAFANHHLAQQFADSEQNALFIVPEAPISGEQATQWPVLDDLLSTVLARLKATMPPGPLIVVGHSGAYRVIVSWLGDARVQHVILVDALYGSEDEFGEWIDAGVNSASAGAPPVVPVHRMTIVGGKSTRKWAEPFVAQRGYAVTRVELPEAVTDLNQRERSARLLYLRTEVGHMELITEGKVVPILLHRTALKRLAPPKPVEIEQQK